MCSKPELHVRPFKRDGVTTFNLESGYVNALLRTAECAREKREMSSNTQT